MLNILIVDDSIIVRKQIERIVTHLGHHIVCSAKNYEEAMSAQSNYDIDLVTMDITMTGKNGVTTATDILAKDANIKIVMVTSHGQEDMVADSLKAGASGYILKPITEDKLSNVIKKIFPDEWNL